MKRFCAGILCLALSSSASADCRQIFQRQIQDEQKQIDEGTTAITKDDDSSPYFSLGMTTAMMVDFPIAVKLVAQPAQETSDGVVDGGGDGGAVMTAGLAMMAGTWSSAYGVSTTHDRWVLKQHQAILELLNEAESGDGPALRAYLKELKKDPQFSWLESDRFAYLMREWSEENGLCAGYDHYSIPGFKDLDQKVRSLLAEASSERRYTRLIAR